MRSLKNEDSISCTTIPIAISPCPNDTFFFFAWLNGIVGSSPCPECSFADIEILNAWAVEKKFPIIKISFNCLGRIASSYRLLPVGAALGMHCGPKIVALESFELNEIRKKKVAVPGRMTTAHLLCDLLAPPPKEKLFCRYDAISRIIKSGEADCGVIIHESRFTFQKQGFVEIADLGALWHDRFRLPLPLGGIAIRNDYSASDYIPVLQSSLAYAWKNPSHPIPFILSYSQEKSRDVISRHVGLYVNQETYFLSSEGIEAIDCLFEEADSAGIFSKPANWLAKV